MPQIIDERRMLLLHRNGVTEVTFFFVQEDGKSLKLLARFFSKIGARCIARWLELEFTQDVVQKVNEALKTEKLAKLLHTIDGEHAGVVVRNGGVGLAITDSGKLYLVLRDTLYFLSTTKDLDANAFVWENRALLQSS